jgi:hypothetical protein
VRNIRMLTGQTQAEPGPEQRAAVRSCRAQSSRDTVQCYTAAQTRPDLEACGGELAVALREAAEKAAPAAAGAGSPPPSGTPPASGSSAGQ